jgi:hypothetical protein
MKSIILQARFLFIHHAIHTLPFHYLGYYLQQRYFHLDKKRCN